jgi:hypothetical protein
LVSEGLFSQVGTDRSRTDFPIGLYNLSIFGLAIALASFEMDKLQWDMLVRRQKRLLPKVFGKWKHFAEVGAEELAKKSLKASVETFWSDYDWDAGSTKVEAPRIISSLFILAPKGVLTRAELSKWYGILAKDEHLKAWAIDIITDIIAKDILEVRYWSRTLQHYFEGSFPQNLADRIKDLIE